jgi:hypothetical protein
MYSFKRFLFEFESTLEYHTELNPALWRKDKLRSNIRQKLLSFGREYAKYNNVPGNIIKDIIIVGGSAGYNYTKFSDIDVHVVISRKALGNPKLVDDLLKDKKKLWGLEHHIKVAGFPLEGYIQDTAEKAPASQGIYSLVHNKWIQRPTLPPVFDSKAVGYKAKVEAYMARINHLIDTEAPLSRLKALKNQLARLRSSGLVKGGEYADGNRIFKELRNAGLLDKMSKYALSKFDKKLSLS